MRVPEGYLPTLQTPLQPHCVQFPQFSAAIRVARAREAAHLFAVSRNGATDIAPLLRNG